MPCAAAGIVDAVGVDDRVGEARREIEAAAVGDDPGRSRLYCGC
jgi:hypothetical protein